MSAVVIATAFGGPDVLEIANQPPGEPGPDEALIEIRAAGVNPVDYKAYSGAFGADPARLPLRLGSEASGVVTAAGPGAAGPAGPIEVGAEVIAFRAPGAYAAELVVPGLRAGTEAGHAGLGPGIRAHAHRRDRLASAGSHRRGRR